jgi:hypothetical protein
VWAGLLSDEANTLYDRLVASGGLPADGPAGVPDRWGPALAELSAHGLVWESAGPPRRVRAVSRPVALRRLLGSRERELAEAHRQLADHYTWLAQLERDAAAPAPASSGVDLVRGPDDVLLLQGDLIADARKECRMLGTYEPGDPWPGRPPATGAAVPVRVICTPAALEPAARADPAGDGPEYRVLPDLAVRMTLVDDAALVPVAPAREALLIRAPALVEALSQYFELLWRAAEPVAGKFPPPDDAPAPIQREILRLAAMGLKDDAIARSLGRSSRWVRRHFEVLEERLGATNRFTLGVAAVRRGWM